MKITKTKDYEKLALLNKTVQDIHVLEKLAKDIGATKLELDYWIDNTIAKNFYKKLGFVINREVVHKTLNKKGGLENGASTCLFL
jgi:hypothetical protein